MNGRYELFVCVPNHFVKRVRVLGTSEISILNKLFPNEKKMYIHDGQILSNNYSFNYYNINKQDYVVALTVNDQPTFQYEILKWIQSTKDEEIFREKITRQTNSSVSLENARLRDLRLNRLEQKKYYFAKRLGSQFEHTGVSLFKDGPLSIENGPIEEPNTNPLPVPW